MGVRPRWFLAGVLRPEGSSEAEIRELFASLRAGADEAEVALVGGHTEVTAAVRQPVVVGQMLGIAEHGRVVATGGARPGDVVVQAGPAPVEAGAVVAGEAPEGLESVEAWSPAGGWRAVGESGLPRPGGPL